MDLNKNNDKMVMDCKSNNEKYLNLGEGLASIYSVLIEGINYINTGYLGAGKRIRVNLSIEQ